MLWVKTFHIVFVTAWFAGLFYLPRIFVNLAMESEPAGYDRLLVMARKLYRFMTMLAVPAVLLGLWLWLGYGLGKGSGWLHAKVAIVVLIAAYHYACGRMLERFESRRNTKPHRYYRFFNEAPVLMLIAVVALVVVRPF